MQEIIATTTEALRSYLRILQDGRDIDPELSLTEYGLDSMKAIDILLHLENAFGITFPDQMLNERTFATLNSLSDAVAQVINEQG